MDMKRFFLYAIVIAALALAGCGGNGGGMDMVDNGGPPPPETCPTGQTGTPPNCVTLPPPTCLEDPMVEGCTGPTQAEIDAEKAATAAAATKLTAIGAEGAATAVDADLGGSQDDGTPVTTYTLTIERDRMETKVMIADTDNLADDDPKFTTVMSLQDARGFAGTMNRRINSTDEETGEVVDEVVVVRTDIAEPTARPFAMDGENMGVHLLDANADSDGNSQSLAIVTANVGMVSGVSEFPSAVNQESVPFEEDAEFTGMFNSAAGEYTCASTGCTLSTDDMGKLDSVGGTWYFTPDEDETVDVADTSYLAYGIWLQRTTKDGETTYDEVEAFYQATGAEVGATNIGDLGNVVGSATYNGNSTGVYVLNVYEPSTSGEQEIESATSGLYSADVTLRANFGGGNIGVNNAFLIEGEVDNFHLEKGGDPGWTVKLESADFSGRPTDQMEAGTVFANVFDGETTGDATAARGAWNGGFFGEAADTPADDGAATLAPAHVLGEFNAFFTDGAVLGGFGADKE